MKPIKSYTLKFYALGLPTKGNNFKVYLRYYVTLNSKPVSFNIPTNYTLTKEQVKLLNKNEFGGTIQEELDASKATCRTIINGLQVQYNSLPTPDQLKEFLTDAQDYLPMEKYISDFLKTIEAKKTSRYIYSLRIKQFKRYYDLNLTKVPITTLVNKNTVEKYGEWLKKRAMLRDAKKKKKRSLGKAYIHDLKSTAIRLLNYIAEQHKIPPIQFYLKVPKPSEQYTPADGDFEKMITVECDDRVKLVQEMVIINSFIGLRIEEFLSITTDSIHINRDHIEIHFTDFKHSNARNVVLMDKHPIAILKKHMAGKYGEVYRGITPDNFNDNLEMLAKLALGEKKVTLYNTDKEENITHNISDVITSHCIRRYAIINNIAKYGIDIAKTFSGHTNYQTVERHYAREFMKKDAILKVMRNKGIDDK